MIRIEAAEAEVSTDHRPAPALVAESSNYSNVWTYDKKLLGHTD